MSVSSGPAAAQPEAFFGVEAGVVFGGSDGFLDWVDFGAGLVVR